MVYGLGKPRRLPHPPAAQISLLRRNSAGAPSTKLLGVHFLKPSPMNQIPTNIAKPPELLRKP